MINLQSISPVFALLPGVTARPSFRFFMFLSDIRWMFEIISKIYIFFNFLVI